jgi:hypothetical protein
VRLRQAQNPACFFQYFLKVCDPIKTSSDCDRLLRECGVWKVLDRYQVESWEEIL